ncbi:MAG: tRNA-dihydrouridine synthase [Melioribacteraceae bacterium]|nr:MAG: tRNA-dihydrouridine synthase [Melioribacteraceae bacterium]
MMFGNEPLGSSIMLAPMAEVSDAPFRKIAKECGATLTFTQMVSAKGVVENSFESLKLLAFSRDEKPVGVQILGNDPKYIYPAVKEIARFKPDIIDLNCGCPKQQVTRYKLGAGLLNDPVLLGKLVKTMVSASGGIPVSVKIRLGWDDRNINVIDNVKAAEDNGASLVFIHARTRADKYDVAARWDILADIKAKTNLPIVGNGSVFTPADVVEMKKNTGIDSVLVARGALGNPFIFSRSRSLFETGNDPGEPDKETLRSTIFKHIKLLEIEYTGAVLLNHVKKNIIWYLRYYSGINVLLEKVLSANNLEDLKLITDKHLDNIDLTQTDTPDVAEVEQRFRNKVLFWLAPKEVNKSCYQ